MTLRVVISPNWNRAFCEWIAKQFNGEVNLDPSDTRTLAMVDTDGGLAEEKDILTVVAFSNFTTYCAEITIATNQAKRQKATHEYVLSIFDYIFNYEEKSTVLGFINVENAKSRALAKQFGFSECGNVSDYYGAGKDAVVVQLTKTRWKEEFEPVLLDKHNQRDK